MRYATTSSTSISIFAAISSPAIPGAFLSTFLPHKTYLDKLTFMCCRSSALGFESSPVSRCLRPRGWVSPEGLQLRSVFSTDVSRLSRCTDPVRSGPALRPRPCRPHAGVSPRASTDGSSGGDVANPLQRGDAERAGINNLITLLTSSPMEQWRPDLLEEHLPSLLKAGLFRQTMTERQANARSREEREALGKVDAFLSGYLGQEKRRGSRAKVRDWSGRCDSAVIGTLIDRRRRDRAAVAEATPVVSQWAGKRGLLLQDPEQLMFLAGGIRCLAGFSVAIHTFCTLFNKGLSPSSCPLLWDIWNRCRRY